jgi:transposase InsO family protein
MGKAAPMLPRMATKDSPDPLALAKHAAVCWVEQALREHFSVQRALALASERPWGGQLYSASTLEGWLYTFRKEGFSGLCRPTRKDKGTRKALSPEACEALLQMRRQYPQIKINVLVRQLIEKGTLQPGTFSMPSVYRLLAEHGLDPRSMKHNPHTAVGPLSGPTKAFECARSNELWMTDMMFGPTLTLANGQVVQTRLFGLLDDCSRLVPHAQYYASEKLGHFLDTFRQGLARRGFPDKLYTDRGKIFTSLHLQIVCANLDVRLLHAKPYAAWSKGKQERFFRTLQEDFEARLILDPVHSLEALNQRLWRWIESEYHQRAHRGLEGQCPAQRFTERAVHLRLADPQTDWQRLFLTRAQRRVRLDATVSLEGQLWEVPVPLRGRLVELRYDPFGWERVEVWLQDIYVALAKRCDKQLNSQTYSHHDYERPDQSC